MNLAKPPKRGPKPKKPIKRSSRPARVRKTASGKARHSADIAWAKAVREIGPCAAIGERFPEEWLHQWTDGTGQVRSDERTYFILHRCEGQIEAAHIVRRGYAATRTDKTNGLPLCHWAHAWFTNHPLAWEAFVTKKIGAEKFSELKAKAHKGPKGIA